MLKTLAQRPLIVLLMGIGALAMLVPAAHALWISHHSVARAFFYSSLLFMILTAFVGFATAGYKIPARGYLVSLLAAFLVLPLMLAVPMYESVARMSFLEAWFESVSSITTTGATLYDNPRVMPRSVHLWRALMGWLGGLLMWVSAIAILAPLNIGGFEVRAMSSGSELERNNRQVGRASEPSERLVRYGAKFIPLYGGLTAVLWVALMAVGEGSFVALCHAMSVMATSGISPVGGVVFSSTGVAGEFVILAFMVFAVSRVAFSRRVSGNEMKPLHKDQEVRLALGLIGALVLVLFLRNAFSSADTGTPKDIMSALRAIWGAAFTLTSFLTTTGFESTYWNATRSWAGLETPGLMLVGLSLIGGGVATTAGGIKLLRVFALLKHSQREVERLVLPSSIAGSGSEARQMRRQGAQIAWVFFMLFTISIAVVMLLLSLVGVQFETSVVLAVAALSNTGPLAAVAAESPISYAGIPDFAKAVLAVAMVLGRLEALAIIAMLNPEFWRR